MTPSRFEPSPSRDAISTADDVGPLFLSSEDVVALLDWRLAIDTLRDAYAVEASPDSVPPRAMARTPTAWIRTLTAALPSGQVMGAKMIAVSKSTRSTAYLIALFDTSTAELTTLLDARHVTSMRTAATSALAADHLLARQTPKVALLGSGLEARNHLAALLSIRDVSHVSVFSPTPTNREKLVAEFAPQHDDIIAVDDPTTAVAGADLIICAARAVNEVPILQGEWIADGTVVISIGSTVPEQREVDVETIRRSRVIVADEPAEVRDETGDFLAAREAGVDTVPLHPLAEALKWPSPPSSEGGLLLYKSVGSALQDVAVAEMLSRRARETERGRALDLTLSNYASKASMDKGGS